MRRVIETEVRRLRNFSKINGTIFTRIRLISVFLLLLSYGLYSSRTFVRIEAFILSEWPIEPLTIKVIQIKSFQNTNFQTKKNSYEDLKNYHFSILPLQCRSLGSLLLLKVVSQSCGRIDHGFDMHPAICYQKGHILQ